MVIKPRYIDAETFWELSQSPEYEDKIIELVDGEIVEMSKPGGVHGVTVGNIFGFIWNFVRQHNLGWVTAAETGFIVKKNPEGRDTVRGLDVAFVRLDR
ncbi:MAG: Uma2 family endonuclease, partial [Phototrophicales bacterium]